MSNYILKRDGKYLEFTEQEVRELANQLPENTDEEESYEGNGYTSPQTGDDPTAYVNVGADRNYTQKNSKVSHCCGASVSLHVAKFSGDVYTCDKCFDTCEAVEDTKPDPIEPINEGFVTEHLDPVIEMLRIKQREIIERINLLQQHE